MADSPAADPPSPFIVEWAGVAAARLDRPRRALDLAMGGGRHARLLAALGLHTFGVDLSFDAVRTAVAAAAAVNLVIRGWCADLTRSPLPAGHFDLVVVSRYLERPLLDAIADTVAPGGFLLYETFTTRQVVYGWGPRSPEHLLEPGELLGRFETWDVVCSEESIGPPAMARLVARKTAGPGGGVRPAAATGR